HNAAWYFSDRCRRNDEHGKERHSNREDPHRYRRHQCRQWIYDKIADDAPRGEFVFKRCSHRRVVEDQLTDTRTSNSGKKQAKKDTSVCTMFLWEKEKANGDDQQDERQQNGKPAECASHNMIDEGTHSWVAGGRPPKGPGDQQ